MSKRSERRLKWLMSIGVIVASVAIAATFIATKEEPPRAEKPKEGTLVEVIRIDARQHDVELYAKGTVVPAMEVMLQPEVGGRVVWQSPELVAGGRFVELRFTEADYPLPWLTAVCLGLSRFVLRYFYGWGVLIVMALGADGMCHSDLCDRGRFATARRLFWAVTIPLVALLLVTALGLWVLPALRALKLSAPRA